MFSYINTKLVDEMERNETRHIYSDQLSIFKNNKIPSEVWFYPKLPEVLYQEKAVFKQIEKWVAIRASHQYLSMKQKLYFAFEDREEAIKLIFGEFLLYP